MLQNIHRKVQLFCHKKTLKVIVLHHIYFPLAFRRLRLAWLQDFFVPESRELVSRHWARGRLLCRQRWPAMPQFSVACPAHTLPWVIGHLLLLPLPFVLTKGHKTAHHTSWKVIPSSLLDSLFFKLVQNEDTGFVKLKQNFFSPLKLYFEY